MRRHIKYLSYVLRHKWYVFIECLKLGVPLWIAVFHDWDKFLPDEWFAYARTFYLPDGSRQYAESPEFALAWMLHQHRNKHHWQYWLHAVGTTIRKTNFVVWDRGEAQSIVQRNSGGQTWLELRDYPTLEISAEPMPDVYRREMLADWRGAGKALGLPDTTAWYVKNKNKMRLHPDTRAWIESQLQ